MTILCVRFTGNRLQYFVIRIYFVEELNGISNRYFTAIYGWMHNMYLICKINRIIELNIDKNLHTGNIQDSGEISY